MDALEQALYARPDSDRLIHHSDRGVTYVSIRYTERLAKAGIESSVGSVGDAYDNALAETIVGLLKTEVIRRQGPWRTIESRWSLPRSNGLIGLTIGGGSTPSATYPPIEFEQAYYQRRMRSGRTQITESPENPLRFTFRVDTSAIVMVCHTQFPGKSQVRNPLRSTLWLLAGDALFLH